MNLAEIKARADAATPGPWVVNTQDSKTVSCTWIETLELGHYNGHSWGCIQTDADYEFIAHARTDVVELVDEVERLRSQTLEEAAKICDDIVAGDSFTKSTAFAAERIRGLK